MNNYYKLLTESFQDEVDVFSEGFLNDIKNKKNVYDTVKKELPDIANGTLRGKRVVKRYNNAINNGHYSISDAIQGPNMHKMDSARKKIYLMKKISLNNLSDSKINVNEAKYNHFDKSVSGKYSIKQLNEIFVDKLERFIGISDDLHDDFKDKKRHRQNIFLQKKFNLIKPILNINLSHDKYVKFLISSSAKKIYLDICKFEEEAKQLRKANVRNNQLFGIDAQDWNYRIYDSKGSKDIYKDIHKDEYAKK